MTPEFSRPVRVDRIPSGGLEMDITANEAERKALADRFGILSIDSLTAHVRLKPIRGGRQYRLAGEFTAEVVQACVVTLEPVRARLDESFRMAYGLDEDELPAGAEIEISFEEDEPPDPIEGGTLDVGEAVAEHMALALDPFPRKPGARISAGCEPVPEVEEKPNPFAVLARLRQKKE